MIAPIDDANHDLAAALLARGFSGPSFAFWDDALNRIKRLGGNAELGLPPGQMMYANDQPVGIALTIASQRQDRAAGKRVIINFAAWYIEPEHRWRAAVMARIRQAIR